MQVNPFDILTERQAKKQQRAHHLIEQARQWDKPIRAGLAQLARTIWPNDHRFGLIPAHRYRLRQRCAPGSYLWWIEHDIPPYDRFWCTAYQVELNLDEADIPTLTVQSGTTNHPVRPLTKENLIRVLAQAGNDLPLLIPRHMGQADDP
jgi:hypothetical protein